MSQAVNMPSIDVRVPGIGEVQGRRLKIPQTTYLFRRDAHLYEALQAARERANDPAVLRIASIACSTGAEVDSLLALYNCSDAEGRISVTGYDASPPVVQEAKKGVYTLKDVQSGLVTASGAEEALSTMGFDVSRVPHESPNSQVAYVTADAAPVRAGHDVRFVEHDAAKPLPSAERVHLALANNLMYQIPEERALTIARNMAGILEDEGVLSLGTGISIKPSGPVASMLEREFDLYPIADLPVMYARM